MRKVFLAVGLCMGLAGCGGLAGPVATAIANVAGIGGAIQTISTAVNATATTIGDVCVNYKTVEGDVNALRAGLPASVQSDIADVEAYGDVACANPPTGNVASTVLWFGNLIDQLKNLAATKSSASN